MLALTNIDISSTNKVEVFSFILASDLCRCLIGMGNFFNLFYLGANLTNDFINV